MKNGEIYDLAAIRRPNIEASWKLLAKVQRPKNASNFAVSEQSQKL